MTNLTRRDLFRLSATTGAAVAVGASTATLLGQLPAGAMPLAGYGPLIPDPAGIIDLPAGFTYRVLGASSSTAANAVPATFLRAVDGSASTHAMPGKADGAAVLPLGDGRIAYVLNHENTNDTNGPVPKTPDMVTAGKVYNAAPGLASGGCTTIVLDTNVTDANGFPTVVDHVVAIAGTVKNCAGGATPWGTWLTCEETESTIGGVPHGYVFEIDPSGAATVAAPYVAMGRMNHEAAAVDPATGVVYLTEDASGPRGLVYRFVPNDTSGVYGSLGNGGVLAAMRCTGAGGAHVRDLADVHAIGTELAVGWMTVAEPNPTTVPIRAAFADEQVTRARKFEGAWWSAGTVWIVSSYSNPGEYVAGTEHQGQVWRYDPVRETLTLVWIAEPGTPFNGPDNIVTTPHGGALLCEDGSNPNKLLVGIVGDGVDGSGFALARNMYNGSEFAGADFTPDGQTLVVNTYAPGLTVAIRGPWAGGPTPVVPEVPAAVVLPVAAGLTIAGATWFHQRKNRLAGDVV